MTMRGPTPKTNTPIPPRSPVIAGLILFQVACTIIFLIDVLADIADEPSLWPVLPECGAVIGLLVGIAFEARYLVHLLRRQEMMARGLGVAAGALAELMEGYFRDWGLTGSEQDIAAFTIKGYSIAEIAVLRGSAEATVKTHLNAIYRKAGVPGRGQLVSLLIEDLMRAPLVTSGALPVAGAGAQASAGNADRNAYSRAQ
jgi:DNA-binding CsgD family transcriptional regulator